MRLHHAKVWILAALATFWLSVSLSAVALGSWTREGASTFRWSVGEFNGSVDVPSDSLRFHLPHRWIDAQTFVLRDSLETWKRGVDFLLDPRRGTLRLLRDAPPPDRLMTSFRYFPSSAPTEVRLHRPWVIPDSLSPGQSGAPRALDRPGASRPSSRRLEATRLQVAGSKTFAVEVGSQQDLALKQSLDLSVRGRLGPDIKVQAVLTDRSTPLQPEGTSTQLQDFDRVLVEVEGPQAKMTLGDYELILPQTEFSSYRRQLEGVRGEVDLGFGRLDAVGASSPGSFLTVEFVGREGVQGPYELSTDAGLADRVIVAGSETVWLENKKLIRGENEDYILDYANGSITFMSRNVITAYSRISVDFQYATEAYPRSVYSGGFRSGDQSPFAARSGGTNSGETNPVGSDVELASAGWQQHLEARWLLERDDRNDPLGVALSEERKQRLREAGDSGSDSLGNGIEFVGQGLGEYDRVAVDTLATAFFVYTGADSGSYLIRFDNVGVGKGDYADTTTVEESYFVFVGEGEGDYLPGTALERPESIGLFSLRSGMAGGGFSFDTEVAVSDFDANTFSSIDDGDNQGLAFSAEGSKNGMALAGGELSLGASVRRVDEKFRPVDRLNEAFFGLDWNATSEQLAEGDLRIHADARWRRGSDHAAVEVGRLDNTADFQSDRVIGDLRVTPGPLRFDARLLRSTSTDEVDGVKSPGERRHDHAELTWPHRLIRASLRYDHELSEEGAASARRGSFYHEQSVRLANGVALESWTGSVSWTQRQTHAISGVTDEETDQSKTWAADLEWRFGGGRYLSSRYSRRLFEPRDGRSKQTTDLGQLRWWTRHGPEGLLQQEGRWELSTSQERDRIRVIEFVGEGEGHYDSLGVFEGIGDYELFFLDQPEGVAKNRIDASFRTEIDRGRSGDVESTDVWSRLTGSLRLVHYWTSRVETDRSGQGLWSNMPALLWGSERAPIVEVTHRGDLTTLSGARWLSPRLRYERRRTIRDDAGDLTDRVARDVWGLRLRSQPTPRWSSDLEQEWETDERSLEREASASVSRTGWRSRTTKLENQLRVAAVVFRLEGSARRRERIGSAETADVTLVSPGLVWSPRPRSRFEVETTRTWVGRENGATRASRDLERPGWSSRIVSNVRLRESLDLSLFFRERRPEDGATVRDSRLELRATF